MGTFKSAVCVSLFTVTLVSGNLAAEDSPQPVLLEPALAQAIRQAHVDEMRRLLADHPSQLEARDEFGWTPLMLAAFYADDSCLQRLLELGAKVNATSPAGATALHYAATNLAKVKLLLEFDADASAVSGMGNTPLMLAARSSPSSPTMRALLSAGADPHARNLFGVDALMLVASTGDAEGIRLLLDHEVSPLTRPHPNPKGPQGKPIDPIFGGGQTALSWAARTGNVEAVTLLLDAGADVNGQAMFGTPLLGAVQKNRTRVGRLLLERGVRIEAVSPTAGWTPLLWAAANEYGDPTFVKMLVDHYANVNVSRGQEWGPFMSVGQSPLMVALRRGETDVVALLREAGAREVEDPWAIKTRPPSGAEIAADKIDAPTLLESIAAAVPLLEHTAVESCGEFAAHGQNCVSCHNQLLPLMAVSTAKSRGIPHDEDALHKMLQMLRPPAEASASLPEVTFDPSPTTFAGYAAWGLAGESVAPYFALDSMIHAVAVHQLYDGSWLQAFPRPPMTDGEISSTALAVRALTLYPLPGRKQEMRDRVDRARAWLRTCKPRVAEEYVYKLLGLYWADEEREVLDPLVKELADLQRADGGWAQLPRLESDAYATGQALYALHQVGGFELSNRVFRKGIAYLVNMQADDGSWFVRRRAYPFQPTMDPKFPHGRDAWISTAATCWAVMALSVALNHEDVERVIGEGGFSPPSDAVRELAIPAAATRSVDYENDILPILETSCLDCHNTGTAAGRYVIETPAGLIKGGFSGGPVVIPGNSAASPLIHHVSDLIEDVEMPPRQRRDEYERLSDHQIGLLRAWIDQGLPGFAE